MDQVYKDFEKTIKTKHSFGWTPKFKALIETTLKKEIITEVASRVFEKLEWDIIHKDKDSAEGRRKINGTWTEKIIIRVLAGNKIEIESTTLGNEMWDLGRNSKRVKFFEFVFRKEETEFDFEKQKALEVEIQKKENWDDYIIPETLPLPKERIEPTFAIPAVGGILVSIFCAFLIAYVSVNGIYVIGLYESLIGIAFGFSLKYFIRWGNFTDGEKIKYLIYSMVGIFFFANQIFQYEIIMSKNNISDVSFLDFIKLRFENGLKIKSLNTGWIGLVVSWIIQVLVIYWITILRAFTSLIAYQSERVPAEVIDFAYYHFVKGKSEREVKLELAKMRWKTDQSQKEVFESISAIGERQEFIRET